MFNEFFLVLLCCFCNFAVITIQFTVYGKNYALTESDIFRTTKTEMPVCALHSIHEFPDGLEHRTHFNVAFLGKPSQATVEELLMTQPSDHIVEARCRQET